MNKLEVIRATRYFPALCHRDFPGLRIEHPLQVIPSNKKIAAMQYILGFFPWIASPFLSQTRESGLYECTGPAQPIQLPKSENPITEALLLQIFGLATSKEIAQVQEEEILPETNWKNKYTSFDELVQYIDQERRTKPLRVGLITGAFDPPHVGHARAIATIWPYCDLVLVGVDSNALVSWRKSRSALSVRPRFSSLAWRMREIASLPFVDLIFKNPVKPSATIDADFENLYHQLGVTVLGSGNDNVFLNRYVERMQTIGGHVVVSNDTTYSSTTLLYLAKNNVPEFDYPSILWKEMIADAEREAVAAGFPM